MKRWNVVSGTRPAKKVFIINNNKSNECVRCGVNKRRLRLSNYPECQSGGSFCLQAVRLVLMNAVACAHAQGFFFNTAQHVCLVLMPARKNSLIFNVCFSMCVCDARRSLLTRPGNRPKKKLRQGNFLSGL